MEICSCFIILLFFFSIIHYAEQVLIGYWFFKSEFYLSQGYENESIDDMIWFRVRNWRLFIFVNLFNFIGWSFRSTPKPVEQVIISKCLKASNELKWNEMAWNHCYYRNSKCKREMLDPVCLIVDLNVWIAYLYTIDIWMKEEKKLIRDPGQTVRTELNKCARFFVPWEQKKWRATRNS